MGRLAKSSTPSTITIHTGTTLDVRWITLALSSTEGVRSSISAIGDKTWDVVGVPSAAYAWESVVTAASCFHRFEGVFDVVSSTYAYDLPCVAVRTCCIMDVSAAERALPSRQPL